jgi:uncharacterized protein
VDFHFLYQDIHFVWNTEKAAANAAKHGIHFEIACQVFFDRFIHFEDASVEGEQRDAAIGMTEEWLLLVVIHMDREDGSIRVISARRTTEHERRAYEDSE